MARIAVIGVGYVGLTTAACLAHLGHHVNPEFLREGTAVHDWLNPERIVSVARIAAP